MENIEEMLNEIFSDEEPAEKLFADIEEDDEPIQNELTADLIEDATPVEGGIDDLFNEPKKKENSPTRLEAFDGENIDTFSKILGQNPVPAKANIARIVDGKVILIAVSPIKIIEASDEDVKILAADHTAKTQNLSKEEMRAICEFEAENKESLKRVFGTDDIKKINNLSDKEYGELFTDVPREIREIVERLSAELGRDIEITPSIANAKDENEILKILIRG